MKRIRQHPAMTVLLVAILVVTGLVAFRLTSSGAKPDSRKPRLITVERRHRSGKILPSDCPIPPTSSPINK